MTATDFLVRRHSPGIPAAVRWGPTRRFDSSGRWRVRGGPGERGDVVTAAGRRRQ